MHNQARSTTLPLTPANRLPLTLAALLGALLLLLAAWQGAAAAAPQPIQQAGDAVTVNQADSSLGPILVDANGMSLYMFDKDTPGVSNCYEGCAKRWPPLLIGAGMQPQAGAGVTAQLGVTERTDGTYQVTAGGWPLYYWYEDVQPGDVLGQAVGDVWWVMTPAGEVVRGAGPAAEIATEAAADSGTEAAAEIPAAATMEATAEATAEATSEAATGAAGASGPAVAWSDVADMGRILVAANGMTLYMFDKDSPGVSNCYGECAQRWPPLLVAAGEQPTAADGITAKLGVTERTDGTYQVTANGWPLYFWWKDVNPGDASGQAVGDVWWVMSSDGTPLRAAAAEAPMGAATMEATAEATMEAPMEATAEPAMAAPQQMPVTGGDGGLLSLLTTAVTLGGLLASGGWLALRGRKR